MPASSSDGRLEVVSVGGGEPRRASSAVELIAGSDFDLPSEDLLNPAPAGGVPGVGGETKSL